MVDIYLLLFLATVAFVVGATVWGIQRVPADERATMGLLARRPWSVAVMWLALSSIPAAFELFQPLGPVPPQLMLIAVFALAFWFSLSRVGGGIARETPLHLLIGFQAFRLPLELVLGGWVETDIAPPQMTWTGANIDIIAGIVALGSIPVVRRWERFAWVPTVVGMVLLANVVWVVARSLPGPLQAFPEVITLPNRFPHIWIATVCVPAALAAHIVALRALLRPDR